MVFPDHRGRRLRKHNSIRESLAETHICVQNLVMPYFIDESNKIRSSTGVAASWLSPIGPLSFVFSTNLSKADTDKTESFNFNLGTTF